MPYTPRKWDGGSDLTFTLSSTFGTEADANLPFTAMNKLKNAYAAVGIRVGSRNLAILLLKNVTQANELANGGPDHCGIGRQVGIGTVRSTAA